MDEWRVEGRSIVAGMGERIAEVGYGAKAGKHARLIAAVPELLEALKKMLAKYDGTGLAEDAARAAIAKAECLPCPNCDDGCKAEKLCGGCDQTICAGCYAEHNHDLHCHLKDHKACSRCDRCVECEACECPEKK